MFALRSSAIRVAVGHRPFNTIRKSMCAGKSPIEVYNSTHEVEEDGYRVPSVDLAQIQPRRFQECDNEILYVMSVNGDYGARKERLVREVMRVDSVTWREAREKVDTEINQANDAGAWLVRLPYQVGVVSGLLASVSAVPLVFHRPTAAWFNEQFVHEDVPDGGLEELDTFWKVGNWTWGWMEPYLGTASFVLLGLQFTRINMQRLHWMPYTERILEWRANRLARQFPQYNTEIVKEFSEADPWD